ncbi:MAG: YebC/PmpR family DNA-binding transcriptional regulator [Oscillospiraceae bacterium]|nr:YebC/PmpR family DNA-binding transcriptional regulator [Oscillospiraceae bacterium]
MSGHSKWNNIKRKKEKTDAQKAKVFTKIGREIAVAVKEGGADPSSNSKLRDLIAKAKANNVPNDNIDRVIKKAGSNDGKDYETIVYEGYGPSGIAVIVECLTDNRNRTAADMRHYFDKFGGNMGQSGCVSYLFSESGIIVIENNSLDEDEVMEACVEAGAGDFEFQDDIVEIVTEPSELSSVREALSQKYNIISAEVEKIPSTYVRIDDAEIANKMNLLLSHMEDNDDVQNVYHNWENMEDFED